MWLLGSDFNMIAKNVRSNTVVSKKCFFIDKEYPLIIKQTIRDILEQIGIIYYFILIRRCQSVIVCVIERSKLKFDARGKKLG